MYIKKNLRLVPIVALVTLGALLFLLNISNQTFYSLKELQRNAELMKHLVPPSIAQRLRTLLNCKDKNLQMEVIQYGEYWLIRNLYIGQISRNIGCAESITYTSNGDFSFMEHIPTVTERWHAPVSMAVHAPGDDMFNTLDSIQYLRHCLPTSALIRDYVTFHVYFPATHLPKYVPHSEVDALAWPFKCTDANGTLVAPPYLNVNSSAMYKSVNNLTYPINVGRNIARKAANTHFVFASDIELYPSLYFVRSFMEMIDRNNSIAKNTTRRVFPMPVFELVESAHLPNTKSELMEQLRNQTAFPFHKKLCNFCHEVPQQRDWYNATETNGLSVFGVGKRTGKHKYWEPFYVSDNMEPLFDERVTWEGQSNKRIQGYAMCLLDYEFHILHPAFLVHSPGIKHFNPHSPRLKFVKGMNKIIKNTIKPEYQILYGQNKLCTS